MVFFSLLPTMYNVLGYCGEEAKIPCRGAAEARWQTRYIQQIILILVAHLDLPILLSTIVLTHFTLPFFVGRMKIPSYLFVHHNVPKYTLCHHSILIIISTIIFTTPR